VLPHWTFSATYGKVLIVNVTVENLAACKKLVRVEVEAPKVDETFESITKEFQKQAVLRGHLGVIRQVRFTPDGKELASVCDGGRVIFWSLDSKEKSREWQLPAGRVCSVAFTTDTRYLAAGTSEGVVDLYRLYAKKKDSE